ncbi:MAG: tripartite tricarboxylate transporter permease [Proteobacteria bacterium]|nr:tripartite tricarboxylate transporter permease [Pseudomonadota bacterium]
MTEFALAWKAMTASWAVPAAFFGVFWGIIGGALPGISPSIAMALLLPFTYSLDPITAVVLLASVYVGAEYGGSIPAILIRTPGTNSAAATVLDGFEMHRRGRGGEALGISLVSGLVGGLFGLALLALLTEPLARVALAFTPPAYFGLGILGLSVIASLTGRTLVKGLIAGVLGFMVATIGTDPVSGVSRFTFGSPDLLGGIRPILIMVGLFAVSELMAQVIEPPWAHADQRTARLKLPDWATWKRMFKPHAIGCVIGSIEGVTPGAGGTIAAFLSYNEARRWSKHPEEFGHGSIEGIAAPECANNVVTGTALVPLLGLGIPGSNSAAVLLGGFLIHGLTPGPMLFERSPEVVYGLYAGLFVANIAMLLLGLVILTPCLWLVNCPKPYLMAFILALIVYAMRGFGLPFLPMVLGVVLGFLVESNYRRSLVLSGGDHAIFVQDPIALGMLVCAAAMIAVSVSRELRASRRKTGEAAP